MGKLLPKESQKYYKKILRKVNRFASIYKSLLLGEKILFFSAIFIIQLLIAITLDNIFHLSLPYRIFFFSSLLITAITIITQAIFTAIRQGITADEAALIIEKKFTDLNNILINSIQLGREKISSSPELINLLIEDSFKRIRQTKVKEALNLERIIKYALVNIGLGLLLLTYIYFFPQYFKNGFIRIVYPFVNIEAILRTNIEIFPSGKLVVLNGADVEIKVKTSGKAVQTAKIYYQLKGEKREQAFMLNTAPDKFSYQFKKVLKPIQYYIKAGDATTPTYEIEIIYPPFVSDLTFQINYPAYTRLPPKQIQNSSGDLSVLYGANLEIKVTPNNLKNIAKTSILLLDENIEKPLSLIKNKMESYYFAEFQTEKTFSYKINLEDTFGYKNDKETPHTIEVLADTPPTISLKEPVENIKVDADSIVTLWISASDDYGLKNISLHYTINGENPQKITLRQTGKREITQDITFTHKWNLEPLSVTPGDLIEYYISAEDNDLLNGPKIIQTNTAVIKIMSFYDKREIILTQLVNALALVKKLFISQIIIQNKMELIVSAYGDHDLKKLEEEWEKLLSRQHNINETVKNLRNTLASLEETENPDEEVKNKLVLLLSVLNTLVDENIYSYQIELERIIKEEKIKDKKLILTEIVSWENNFYKKILQFWKHLSIIYEELKQASISHKLNQLTANEERLRNNVQPFLGKPLDSPKETIIKQLSYTQKLLVDDLRLFILNLSKTIEPVRNSILNDNIVQIMNKVNNDLQNKELVLSDMEKSLTNLKKKEIEKSVQNLTLAINKLKKIALSINSPLEEDSQNKINQLLNFLQQIETKITKLIETEKSFLVYLTNQKFSTTKKYFSEEKNYHDRVNLLLKKMIETLRKKPKEEIRKIETGIKHLTKATESKEQQISALQKKDIHMSIFYSRAIIQELEKAKVYFTKFKKKIEQVKQEKPKNQASKKEDLDKATPVVKILKPGKDLLVLHNAEIPIVIEAKDDYGISTVDFVYQILPHSKKQTVPIAKYPSLKDKTLENYKFSIRALGLKDKTTIRYYAQAIDDDVFKKNIGKSKTYQIMVIPPDSLAEEKKQKKEDQKTYQEVKTLVKEILIVTFREQVKLKEQIHKIQKQQDNKEGYETLLKRQHLLEEEIQSVLQIMAELNNSSQEKNVLLFIRKVRSVLLDIERSDMKELLDALKDLTQSVSILD